MLLYVLFQLGVRHRLLLVADEEEVARFHSDDGIHEVVMRYLLSHAPKLSNGDVTQMPLVADIAQGVVLDGICREVRNEFLVLELVEREVDARLAHAVEVLHVGNDARFDLQLHLVCVGGVLLSLLISVFEGKALDAAARDDFCSKIKGHGCNDGGTNHIGEQQASATDARAYHRYDFAAVCHLRGEEDDADEDEECAEEVGVVGDEVEVIIHYNRPPWCLRLSEAVDVLVEIEHHADTDNQHDGEEVSPEELSDYVTVNPLHLLNLRFDNLLFTIYLRFCNLAFYMSHRQIVHKLYIVHCQIVHYL